MRRETGKPGVEAVEVELGAELEVDWEVGSVL